MLVRTGEGMDGKHRESHSGWTGREEEKETNVSWKPRLSKQTRHFIRALGPDVPRHASLAWACLGLQVRGTEEPSGKAEGTRKGMPDREQSCGVTGEEGTSEG